jgi:Bacterial antitoxin of type II TA system, VapB
MNTRTNIVLNDELVAQAMTLARVTTKKAAVEAALRAYVRKPDYSALLALRGKDLIDPDYDPRGPYGLTQAALERRGWHTFEDARLAHEKQLDERHPLTTKQAKQNKKTTTPKTAQKRKLQTTA